MVLVGLVDAGVFIILEMSLDVVCTIVDLIR